MVFPIVSLFQTVHNTTCKSDWTKAWKSFRWDDKISLPCSWFKLPECVPNLRNKLENKETTVKSGQTFIKLIHNIYKKVKYTYSKDWNPSFLLRTTGELTWKYYQIPRFHQPPFAYFYPFIDRQHAPIIW